MPSTICDCPTPPPHTHTHFFLKSNCTETEIIPTTFTLVASKYLLGNVQCMYCTVYILQLVSFVAIIVEGNWQFVSPESIKCELTFTYNKISFSHTWTVYCFIMEKKETTSKKKTTEHKKGVFVGHPHHLVDQIVLNIWPVMCMNECNCSPVW